MQKKYIFGIILIIVCILGIVYTLNQSNKTKNDSQKISNVNNSTYETQRTESTLNITMNNELKSNNEQDNMQNGNSNNQQASENKENDNQENQHNNEVVNQNSNVTPVEETIATFSTKIYTKDSARQNNLVITCSTLNGTEVPIGETFSFCNTVGKATSDRGYKKADIFTSTGKKVKGIGGGNCQISTTLYNAVLQVPELTVTERHEHSNKVPYIQSGKDAAVAYGSCDLKFVNNTDGIIKILAQNTPDLVTITLTKVTYK